jgi:isocitrate dehydrogenase kinase/phosphatase
MADTWEFSHAAFPLDRFDPELLEELKSEAANKVTIENDRLVISHLYIERRLNPLNLYLEQVDEEKQRLAMREYGNALREIAASGIFPGDLLLKNFGVTRHGRVIFYDYDEIVPINECRFREIPEAMTPEQEMASEPWYSIAENDVFPEEFMTFLMNNPTWRKLFREEHGGLAEASTWRDLQEIAARGKSLDVYPYRRSISFPR